jgi:hypothetical protein
VPENGDRVGGYILIKDADTGIRFAVRPHAVAVAHDEDPCRDSTILVVAGGRTVRVGETLEEVLA